MKIHLMRHTRPQVEAGICYGHTDLDVAESFADELQAVREKLAEGAGRVISSPLRRCRRLAEALTDGPVGIDARLREMDFGDWEHQPWSDIERSALDWWSEDVTNRPCPNGESYGALYRRSIDAFAELRGLSTPIVTLVTHAGVIRAILAHTLEIPLPKSFLLDIDFGSRTTLVIEAKITRVVCVNQ